MDFVQQIFGGNFLYAVQVRARAHIESGSQ